MRLGALFLTLALGVSTSVAAPPVVITTTTATAADASSPSGVWRFGADGAIFTIESTPGVEGAYSLILEESPDLSLAKGTAFGTLKSTGTALTYECALLSDPSGRRGIATEKKVRHFILTLSPDGSQLSFKPYRKGKNINLLRWIPYLVRISVTETDTRPRDVDAATRIDPAPTPSTITI